MQTPLRALTQQEQSWIIEILNCNPDWTGVNPGWLTVIAENITGNSRTMKLSSEAPSKPNQRGTRGYIGRLDIRTDDNFGITITLDQYDGSLYELYIAFLDLEEKGDRPQPLEWEELANICTKM